MQQSLIILLTFYSLLLLANTFVSFTMWKVTKEHLYKTSSLIWIGTLLNFGLQGVFKDLGSPLLLAFASYSVVALLFLKFANEAYQLNVSLRKWSVFSLMGVFTGVVCWNITQNFVFSAALLAVTIAMPQFYIAYRIFANKRDLSAMGVLFGVLLVLNALHFLDYPYLRFHPMGALWGYSIAYFLLVMMSIFIPCFIVSQVSGKYQSRLEREVHERTQELKVLSEQNAALLSIVCHDLATPLTVLQVASGFLTSGDARKYTNEELEKCQKKLTRAMNTVREIMYKVRSLQQLRFGKTALVIQNHDPVELIQDAVLMFEDQAREKNIKIVLENNLTNNQKFKFDKIIMKNQVIMNLLSNALKFSLPGSHIRVVLSSQQDQGVIDIIDCGVGIPEDILPHLFDFSGKTSRLGTNNEKGTGFGLPLVKASLEMMGAKIIVRSNTQENEEKGTRFRLELPKAA